jgi:XTP/dITP diphosphohydrolase
VILHVCSGNKGKLREFAAAAEEYGPENNVVVLPLPGLESIRAPEETGTTFEENAAIKALFYSTHSKELTFADDSGLEVDALGGEPGVYSARFAGPNATDVENNELLLQRLGSSSNRHARFRCAIALAREGQLITVVHGSVEGEVLEGPRGSGGFGYDPLFLFSSLNLTLAELDPVRKLEVSHRGRAIRALLEWLRTHAAV